MPTARAVLSARREFVLRAVQGGVSPSNARVPQRLTWISIRYSGLEGRAECPPPRGHTIAQFDTYWHLSPGPRDSPRSLAGTARACSRTHLVSTDFGDTSPECLRGTQRAPLRWLNLRGSVAFRAPSETALDPRHCAKWSARCHVCALRLDVHAAPPLHVLQQLP